MSRRLGTSYEHLLTPLTPPKETSVFELESLQEAINKQQKHRRIRITSSATVIPFCDHYINNFSAEMELKRVEQMNCAEGKTIEIRYTRLVNYRTLVWQSWMHWKISQNNPFSVDTSLDDLLIEQRELNELQKLLNEQIERKAHNVNQLGWSERQPARFRPLFQQYQLPATNTANRLLTDSTGVPNPSTHQLNKGISMNPNIRSRYEPTNLNLLNVDLFESFLSQADQPQISPTQQWSKEISVIPNDRNGHERINSNLCNCDLFESFCSQADQQPQILSTQQFNNGMSMVPNNRSEYEPMNFNPLNSDPFSNFFNEADREPQMPSTHKFNNGMSMIWNNRSEYDPTNFNLLNGDPFSKLFSQADHYQNATQNLFSSNRSQDINSNGINQNDYERPSQINSLIPNPTGNNMNTSHLMNYNYKPSYTSNTFSSHRNPYFTL